jgi:hypothetical protein
MAGFLLDCQEDAVSVVARKSGNRTVMIRQRALNGISGWDEAMPVEPNEVFVPVSDADEFLERMDHCIAEANLDKRDHQFLDGGVLVRFRRKRDADMFRHAMAI